MVTREGGEENRCYKEDTTFRRLQGELSVYAENVSDSFFKASQSKSIGSKCHQNYHQHVVVSCTWESGRGGGGEGWTVGLIPYLGHISRSIAAASHSVSHLL